MPQIKKFKHSIILGFLFATFLPLIVLGYFGYSYLSFKIHETGQRNNELLAKSFASEISTLLREPLIVLTQVSLHFETFPHDEQETNSMLNRLVDESDLLDSIYFIDREKKVTHIGLRGATREKTNNYIGLDLSGMSVMRNIEFLQGPYWSRIFSSPISGRKNLAIIHPAGEERYVIGLFDVSQLHKMIVSQYSWQNLFTIILDDAGEAVFFPELNVVEEQYNFSHILPFKEAQLGNFGTYEFVLENTQYLGTSANISETKWLVLVAQSRKEARQPIFQMTILFTIAMVIAALIVSIISMHQLRRLMLPLKTLQENIQAVAKGDYQEETTSGQLHEEFADVDVRFREMANAVERREQLLEINEERLVALLQIHNLKHLTESELFGFALEQAVTLTRSDVGFIHILDGMEKGIDQSFWSEGSNDFSEQYGLTAQDIEEDGLWSESIEKRKRVLRNVTIVPDGPSSAEEKNIKTFTQLCVPIFDGDAIVAVVGVLNKLTEYDSTDARQLSLYFNHTWDILQQKRSERQRERLSEQLAQAQKLEAIGTLAGGIAHDFNNVLMVIIGNTEIAKDHAGNKEKVEKDLDQIFKASLRARDLVNQILVFSRKGTEGLKPMDIQPIVKEAVKLLRSSLPANIEIIHSIVTESKQIVSEPGQINQLIMNLCTNAYQAMGGEKGRLEILLHPITLDQDLLYRGKMVAVSGEYIQLIVRDTGKGISEESIHRIFDPYYTTREKERGTGLGLAVVHGIVKGLKGGITVESTVGKGTEFTLYFPVVKLETVHEKQILSGRLPGGNERILFLDDDKAVATVNSRILENLGYDVTTFTSSKAALAHYLAEPDSYDLIITDMAMPEMTGDIFVQKILANGKKVPIILCTGYSEQIDEAKAKSIGINELVLKPLTKIDLALVVRKVLGFKGHSN